MSDEQTSTLARLEELVEEIESELADGKPASPPQKMSDVSDTALNCVTTNDTKSDIVIDIAQHPLGRRSWLPDAVLNDADSRFEGLTDEIWDKLTQELQQIKPVTDMSPSSDTLPMSDSASSDNSAPDGNGADRPASSPNTEAPAAENAVQSSAAGRGSEQSSDRDAQKLADIQQRIDRYWEKHTVKPNSLGKSLGVVLSLGFIMAVVLYGAYLIGMELVRRSGQGWLLPLCLIIGMISGFYIGFTLLYPLIKQAAKEQPKQAAKAGPKDGTAPKGREEKRP